MSVEIDQLGMTVVGFSIGIPIGKTHRYAVPCEHSDPLRMCRAESFSGDNLELVQAKESLEGNAALPLDPTGLHRFPFEAP